MASVPKFDQVKVGDPIKPIVLPPITRHQLALYCGGSGELLRAAADPSYKIDVAAKRAELSKGLDALETFLDLAH